MRCWSGSCNCPSPMREACRRTTPPRGRLPHRRKVRCANPVRRDAGRGRGRSCASGPRPACSTCAATTARRATASRTRRRWSNCPRASRAANWAGSQRRLRAEFARELFGHVEVGVLPRLVHSRFGLHVVEVLEREAGVAQPFESVRGAVAMALSQQAFVMALRQHFGPAGRRGRRGRRGPRRGRHAAGPIGMAFRAWTTC